MTLILRCWELLQKFPGEKLEPTKRWQSPWVAGPGGQWGVQWHEILSPWLYPAIEWLGLI